MAGEAITLEAQAQDGPTADGGKQGGVAELLAGRDIGDMNLDNGGGDGCNGIAQGNRTMGIASAIEHHAIVVAGGLLQRVDQLPFVVGLEVVDLVVGQRSTQLGKVCLEGEASVDGALALPLQIEVGAVQDQNFHIETRLTEAKIAIFHQKNTTFVL